ncbi:MAG: hypothetical protein ABL885_12885 [Methylophilaceae bacterium]
MKKTLISLCLLAGFATTALAEYFSPAETPPFDYYMLSLSWSPEFCATHQGNKQCGRGQGLVLHGLWPQYFNGYPKSCSNERITAKLVREFSGLYPADGLAFHEWQKHGTCSGLPPREYLQLSQKLKNSFMPPAALQKLTQALPVTTALLTRQILLANPKLKAEMLAFDCTNDGAYLQEVYVCFDKAGKSAVACGEEVRHRSQRSCGAGEFLVRN